MTATTDDSAWFLISRGIAMPWHCDHYGHMNVRWYAHLFDDASLSIWSCIGIDMRELHAGGAHTVIAKSSTQYRHEVRAGDTLAIHGAFARLGNKSVTVKLRMDDGVSGELRAENELAVVFFDPQTRRSAAVPQICRDAVSTRLLA